MDGDRFDRLTRGLTAGPSSRRRVLRGLAGAALAGTLARFAPASAQDGAAAQACLAPGKKCALGEACCPGATCKQGRCRCKTGTKPCAGKCIPADRCCTEADCPAGQTCPGPGKRCRCPAGTKPCQGKCIPTERCCSPADCDGRACQDGICQPCTPGFKLCFLSCIPEDQCCICGGGKVCQNGQCRCPSGQPECGGICCTGGRTCQDGECTCPSGTIECAGGGPCLPLGGCCSNGDCTGGKICENGICRCPLLSPEIRGVCARSCLFGQQCRAGSGCGCTDGPGHADICTDFSIVSGGCAATPCTSDADCPANTPFGPFVCAFDNGTCGDGVARCRLICKP